MDGVTILSEMSVRGEDLWIVIAWWLLTIAYIACGIWDNVESWRYSEWRTRIVGIICSLMVGSLILVIAVGLCTEYNTFHTEYEVTIDDSVGFNEFTDWYEIVSQDGDVYTVIERELEDATN
jgi:hypothetical protein